MRQAALAAQGNPLYAQGRQLGGVGLSALGQIAQGQAGQRYGEVQNALGRAGQLANLGFGIDPQILSMLQGSIGPYGTTQTTHTQSDPWSQLLGGGLTLASLFTGGGAGAAAGLLGGAFGGGGGGGGFPAFGSGGLGNINPFTGQRR